MAEYNEKFGEKYLEWTQGDIHAANFIHHIGQFQHIADDFIDGDVPGTMTENSRLMGKLMHLALIEIPLNPFYQKHQSWLMPHISAAIIQSGMADEWYDHPTLDVRTYSFVWRGAAEQIIHAVALLIGGFDHAKWVAQDYRDFWLVNDPDRWDHWMGEHT